MDFIIPTDKTMSSLYNLVEELFEKKFFNFVENLGQRIFFITTSENSYVAIISPDEYKIDIFSEQEEFLSCHNLLSGDTPAVYTYGICNLGLETMNDNVFGSKHYLEKFNFYKTEEQTIGYVSRKLFQRPVVVDQNEALKMYDVLSRLIVIQNEFEQLEFNEKFEEEMVFVFNFKDEHRFEFNYMLLNNFDFFPNINGSVYEEYGLLNTIKSLNVVPGVLHIGQVDTFKPYEICDSVAPFDIGLTAILFYSLTEDGDVEHILYASPREDYNRIFMFIISNFFKDKEVYDTIITDNMFVYFALANTLSEYGIEVKYEPNNDFNSFITKFMIKVIQMDDDVEVIDELILSTKEELKEVLLENIDNLSEFNERFLLPFDEIIAEEEEEIFDDEDDEDGFIS